MIESVERGWARADGAGAGVRAFGRARLSGRVLLQLNIEPSSDNRGLRVHPLTPLPPAHARESQAAGTAVATSTAQTGPAHAGPGVADKVVDKVVRILNLIRPAVQADGGDIEFVGLTPERIVQIRMHGACVGCPSSTVTLQTGIERNLREHVPEIRGVQAVD